MDIARLGLGDPASWSPPLRQQGLSQTMLLECVDRTAAQGALAARSGAWAGGERRETRARLQAAEVAGEDGGFGRAVHVDDHPQWSGAAAAEER